MLTRVTAENGGLWLINASNGRPEEPSPNSGELITMPQVLSSAGRLSLGTLKPGDVVNTVWTHQTAIGVKIIRQDGNRPIGRWREGCRALQVMQRPAFRPWYNGKASIDQNQGPSR